MHEDTSRPGININIAKIPVSAGIAGAIFAAGAMSILLVGVPMLQYLFPAALVVGMGVALVLHAVRREAPGATRILSGKAK